MEPIEHYNNLDSRIAGDVPATITTEDYRALAAQLAHVAMQAKTEMNRLGNILNWSTDIPKSYAAAMNAISNQFETGAVDAARKAGVI